MYHPDSRYDEVSRRALLRGAAGLGAVLLAPGLAACSASGDEETFAGAVAEGTSSTTSTTTTPTETEATETETTETSSSQAPAAEAAPIGEATIAFTYEQGAGGKDLPPYVAVWIEDADGELVDTVALWYEQSQKGSRWLSDLRRWFSLGQNTNYDTLSSATRLPGKYTLVWDGSAVAAGNYHVCIESARERGPYSLIRAAVDLPAGGTVTLPDDGELVAASITTA